jgi:hypothetical protein
MKDKSKRIDQRELVQTVDLPVQPVDMVNSPSQYTPNGVDSFMHMKDQIGAEAFRGFLQGNVIKYTQRYRFKGKPVEDLTKASFYLFHLGLEAAGITDKAKCKALVEHFLKTLTHSAGHYGIKVGEAKCGVAIGGKA